MEIPFSLTENGYENTPCVRKSGGFLPVKTGKSASKIALRQRRSVFLRSNSENFPFHRMKQRLFESKTGDFAVSLDERKIYPQFPNPILQVRSRKIRVRIQVIVAISWFLSFLRRFLSHASGVLGVFGMQTAYLVFQNAQIPSKRGFFHGATAERTAMVSKL